MLIHDPPRGRVHLPRATVVTQTFPSLQHSAVGGGSQGRNGGKCRNEAFKIALCRGHLGLLKHDLADPNSIGVAERAMADRARAAYQRRSDRQNARLHATLVTPGNRAWEAVPASTWSAIRHGGTLHAVDGRLDGPGRRPPVGIGQEELPAARLEMGHQVGELDRGLRAQLDGQLVEQARPAGPASWPRASAHVFVPGLSSVTRIKWTPETCDPPGR